MIKKVLFFITITLFLSSCLNFKSIININDDLTGSIEIEYSGAPYVWEVKSFEEEKVLCLLPSNLEVLNEQLEIFPGLILENARFDWGAPGLTARISINFENPDQLTPLLSFWGGRGVANFTSDV